MSAQALAPDAAMALGMASTAMPFARTPEAQVERWLRILRLHGMAGRALQAVGLGEKPLQEPKPAGASLQPPSDGKGATRDDEQPSTRGDDRDTVGHVAAHARQIAAERRATGITTTDLLLAVMQVYGACFDSVIETYGTDRNELLARLEPQASRT